MVDLEKYLRLYRDREVAAKIVKMIRSVRIKERVKIMHVCGTHENTISRYAIRSLLPDNVSLIAGPGCPVCICPSRDIDEAIYLSHKEGVLVASYGDMLRTPATNGSLWKERARGGHVQLVYSVTDAVELARKREEEVVFLSVGFETTAPGVAWEILNKPPENFSIISSHRLIPPILKALLMKGDVPIDGIIAPGHVCTVIGYREFEDFPRKFKIPTAVVGFEPVDVLIGIYMLLKAIEEEDYRVINEYSRSVKRDGNRRAVELMKEVFEVKDANWRGIGIIPKSGLFLRKEFEEYDARKKFDIKLDRESVDIIKGCRCHEIVMGKIEPLDCPLFGKSCTPAHPLGPCMVSDEGTCKIWYKYYRRG
ncbi:MAG: hydrogenase formation protein HypD [Candidatus Asgardarchaeia archaeon]